MRANQISDSRGSSFTGMLADIANEFSYIDDWKARIRNAICIIEGMFLGSKAAAGIQLGEWEFVCCRDSEDTDRLEASLRQSHSMLTAEMSLFPQTPLEEERLPKCENCLNIPIIGSGRMIGVLHVQSPRNYTFTADDVSVVSASALMIGSFAQNVMSHYEEVRMRHEVEELKEQYLDLYDFAPVGYFTFDSQGTILSANLTGAKLLDAERDALIGRHFQFFIDEDARDRFSGCVKEIIKTGEKRVFDVAVLRDGEPVYLQIEGVAIEPLEGNAKQCRAAVIDITERKLAEETIRNQVYLLQRALLPAKRPIIEGYSVASAYIPAFAGQEIGGDFLDVFQTEDGKVGIMIGDVSDKGIESASLAATTRSTVRAFAYDSSSPSDALAHANSLLTAQQIDYMQFVTAFLVVLDPTTGGIRYSSAGHLPAIVSRGNSDMELLSTHNLPLGVLGGSRYEDGHSSLRPGDSLVLYTDGITEARHDHVLFGIKGIKNVLAVHSHTDPDKLVTEILDAVKAWAHGRLRDDTAVLIISRDV